MAVGTAAYEIPTDAPESDGTFEWDSTTIVVVEVHCGDKTGLGYTYCDAAAGTLIESKLAEIVADADPMAPPATHAAMEHALRNLGATGIGAMAMSAVDIALWDLKARLLDRPLADILLRVRDSVPIYGSGGFTSYTVERLCDQLAGWVGAGIPRVKMKVGRDASADLDRVRAVRAAIGDDAELMVDANGAYDRKQARDWAERYAGFGCTWFEEPVTSDDPIGLRLLRDHGPAGLDVAAGEYGWRLRDFKVLADCVDVLQADVTRCGGITNLLRFDGLCRSRELPSSAHCAPAVSAHACCALETVCHIEYFHDHVRIERMLFDGVPEPNGGKLAPDRSQPGLGLVLKRADAARYEL